MQSHVDGCPLCDGPCREPFRLPPLSPNYPFLPPEVLAMIQPPEPEPEVVEEPKPPSGKRAKRLQEDRMRRPAEDR